MRATATIRRYLAWLPVLVLTLTACAAVPESKDEAATSLTSLIDKARTAANSGDYAIAARHYLELAALSSGAPRYDYFLSAAEAFLHGGLAAQAKQSLQSLPAEALDAQQLSRRQMVAAAVSLTEHNPRAAVDALKTAEQSTTPPALRAAIHELRATAYNQLGNFLDAARERVALAPLLNDRDAARHNEQTLWQALLSLSNNALENPTTAPPPDTLRGWLELVAIAKTAPSGPVGIDERVTAWRKRYPQHPASEDLLASLLAQQPERLRGQPSRIALLLPSSGPYAKSAEAIRDGFFAAYFQRPAQDQQPVIQVYDTSAAPDIAKLYAQAVKEGAELVVGPLEKEAIMMLRQSNIVTVPTLVLNYTDSNDQAPAGFYQFGLAPEDEARMVAERAWLEGSQRAAAIIPDGEWGNRIFRAFAEHWQQLGGKVVATQTYAANGDDLSDPLRRLLNIDDSESRAHALHAVLQTEIKFEAWRRHDLDFIFMAAFPRQARQIPPQLKFLYAGDVPIYTTSHAFDGRPDQNKDRDLDGVIFTDIPWLLTPQQFPLRDKIRQLWPEAADQYARLYAMGTDVYRLLPSLTSLSATPYEEIPGATGTLTMDKNNRIHRALMWAHFSGGLPRLLPQTASVPH